MTHKSRIIVLSLIILGIAVVTARRLYRAISEAYQEYQWSHDPAVVAISGSNLSNADIRLLEARIRINPDDLDARAKLLGFHHNNLHNSAGAARLRAENSCVVHVSWLIRHHPESPILETPFGEISEIEDSQGFAECKNEWLKQCEKQGKTPAVLGHAAGFFLLYDKKLAEKFLKQAEQVDQTSSEWPDKLGHLYSLDMWYQQGAERNKSASDAMSAYERALARTTDDSRKTSLKQDAARMAFEAGAYDKAKSYAEQALKDGSIYRFATGIDEDSIHHARIVLGRLALHRGSVSKAKEYLLLAAKTTGSGPLDSFGPNMQLAKDLLEKGERQTVLQYFELCGKFWKRNELKDWANQVRAGEAP